MNKPIVSVISTKTRLTLREIDLIRQGFIIDQSLKVDQSIEDSLRRELIMQTAWYIQKEIDRLGIDMYINLIKIYDLSICAILSNHSIRTDLIDEECPYDGSDYTPTSENLILCGLEYLFEQGVITKQHLAKIKMYTKEL